MKRSDYLNNVEPDPVPEEVEPVEVKAVDAIPDEEWRRWAGANYNTEAEISPRFTDPIATLIGPTTAIDVRETPYVEPQPAPGEVPAPNNSYWDRPIEEAVPMAEGRFVEQRIGRLIDECQDPSRRRILYRALAELVDLEIPGSPPGYNPSVGGISDAEF